ncbi:MAG TPA: helix-turn-helix transcriptional regulator [Micromonosporaceae bacterium]|nr:helix-turn-helix transcriptional regulator [Micromonosporaceae bacterium]
MRPLAEPGADPAVRTLVRQLVATLVEGRPPLLPGSGDVEQLLDIEIDDVRCRVVRVAPSGAAPAALSPREQEIARMVAKGHTNQAIADVLGISAWTVSTHLRRVFAKLGVNSRAAMVAGVLTNDRWPEPVSHLPVTPVHATHVQGSHVQGSQEDVTGRATRDPVAYG